MKKTDRFPGVLPRGNRSFLSFAGILFFVLPLWAGADTFYRLQSNSFGVKVLTDSFSLPSHVDTAAYLARHEGYEQWAVRQEGPVLFVAEQAVEGGIPILCLHKLNRDGRYGLTPARFEALLRFLKHNRWYLVSDRQYLEGDFTRVPGGYKPIVMGADDAAYGQLTYRTRGDSLSSPVLRRAGRALHERNTMAAILEKLASREEGRINFTFYVSFDSLPFRQLGGARDPGFPYRGIPLVAEKIRYLDETFRLGLHSLSHIYAGDIPESAFVQDIAAGWEALNTYAGGHASTVETLAFPYGIENLQPSLQQALLAREVQGKTIQGTFTLDNKLASPPGRRDPGTVVSRINLDNQSWNRVMKVLRGPGLVTSRRLVIVQSEKKRIPPSLIRWGVKASDSVWIQVPSS